MPPPYAPQAPPYATNAGNATAEQAPIAQKKSGKGKVLPVVIIVVVLLCSIGAAAYAVPKLLGTDIGALLPFTASDTGVGRGGGDEGEDFDPPADRSGNEETPEQTGEPEAAPTATEDIPIAEAEAAPLSINITQVDNSAFPEVVLYASILDASGAVAEGLDETMFNLSETGGGAETSLDILELRQMLDSEYVSVNLVLDQSGSMADSNKLAEAKYAAGAFISQVQSSQGDRLELTSFDSYVYTLQPFTGDSASLSAALERVEAGGETALYDAICAALLSTNEQAGARCVVVFTDGQESSSNYTYDDVLELAGATGIPVFIIGIGSDYDDSALEGIAAETGGTFYSAETENLGNVLAEIYADVYASQRSWYRIRYRSGSEGDTDAARSVALSAAAAGYSGRATKEYVPVTDVNLSFSADYRDMDYILGSSSAAYLTYADLEGLSLAELRIARNEIYARYGRLFKDSMLNKWFYSKEWYLSVYPKYSPDGFDALPSPLNDMEQKNILLIVDYENLLMDSGNIFPNASAALLTEYDVSLKKEVLQRALEELYNGAGASNGDKTAMNEIEKVNAELIEYALEQQDISY